MSEQIPPNESLRFHVRQAFKLAISLVLFYAFALWTNWDVPRYGGLAIVIVSLGTRGASIEQGVMRIAGTTLGLAIGLLILALFNDSRWAVMTALAANMAVTCYVMQTSHYQYAWYAAAFVPLVVWADNYPQFNDAFYFSTFRWLETLVGVVIYTLVDLVLWPRSASDQMHASGRQFLDSLAEQFECYRHPDPGANDPVTDQRRTAIAGQLSSTVAAFQNALFDTLEVRGSRAAFRSLLADFQRMSEALEMWHESELDCDNQVLDRFIVRYEQTLETLSVRLAMTAELWDAKFTTQAENPTIDDSLAQRIQLDVDRAALTDQPPLQRAAILTAVRQLQILDEMSQRSLQTMRELCGLADRVPHQASNTNLLTYRPAFWDTQRFINSLFPVATFVVCWMVWVFLNPPGGAKVAMLAGLLSVMIVRTPMNPLTVWVFMLVSTAFVVVPICWLVMPAMSTGYELLTLIFALSFFFGCLGAKSPALKSGPLIQFFASAGISNQQSYSFEGPVNGSLMVLIGGGVVSIIYNLWAPIRPQQALLKSLRNATRRCSEYLREFDWQPTSWQPDQRLHRGQTIRSKIIPALEGIQKAERNLDFEIYPNNRAEDWQAVIASLQRLTYRLRTFDLAYDDLGNGGRTTDSRLASESQRLLDMLSKTLLDASAPAPKSATERRVAGETEPAQLKQTIIGLEATLASEFDDEAQLIKMYTLIGNLRLVAKTVMAIQSAMMKVDLDEIATPRF